MLIKLGAFLQAAVGPLAKRVLAALGLGIISGSAVVVATTQLADFVRDTAGAFTGYVAAVYSLSGLNIGIGMVLGAIAFRAAYAALPKLGVLSK